MQLIQPDTDTKKKSTINKLSYLLPKSWLLLLLFSINDKNCDDEMTSKQAGNELIKISNTCPGLMSKLNLVKHP